MTNKEKLDENEHPIENSPEDVRRELVVDEVRCVAERLEKIERLAKGLSQNIEPTYSTDEFVSDEGEEIVLFRNGLGNREWEVWLHCIKGYEKTLFYIGKDSEQSSSSIWKYDSSLLHGGRLPIQNNGIVMRGMLVDRKLNEDIKTKHEWMKKLFPRLYSGETHLFSSSFETVYMFYNDGSYRKTIELDGAYSVDRPLVYIEEFDEDFHAEDWERKRIYETELEPGEIELVHFVLDKAEKLLGGYGEQLVQEKIAPDE